MTDHTDHATADERGDLPELQDPDFIQMTAALHNAAERANARKNQALAQWKETATDEEIAHDLGVNVDALFRDV